MCFCLCISVLKSIVAADNCLQWSCKYAVVFRVTRAILLALCHCFMMMPRSNSTRVRRHIQINEQTMVSINKQLHRVPCTLRHFSVGTHFDMIFFFYFYFCWCPRSLQSISLLALLSVIFILAGTHSLQCYLYVCMSVTLSRHLWWYLCVVMKIRLKMLKWNNSCS